MKIKLFQIQLLFAPLLFLANAVPSQTITNWGPNVAGVRLALLSTNGVITAGSQVWFECVATNTTDDLIIFALDPHLDMQMHLVGNGTNFDLSLFPPNSFRPGGGPGYGLQPKEMQSYMIPIAIKKNAPTGIYQLTAQIKLRVQDTTKTNLAFQFPMVESSAVPVEVK
jgi:hypothetical protein